MKGFVYLMNIQGAPPCARHCFRCWGSWLCHSLTKLLDKPLNLSEVLFHYLESEGDTRPDRIGMFEG